MLKKKQFTVAGWGKKLWGYEWIPDNPGKYPAVVFFHGLGTLGGDSKSVESLLLEGPMKLISDGWKPDMVFVALQDVNYPPEPLLLDFVLYNDPEIKAAWDGKNILWTGLSAGGFRTLEAAALGLVGSFVPMSSPAFDAAKITLNKTYKAWAIHSDNDTQCPLQNVIAAYQKLQAKITTPHDGHGNWDLYYSPTWKEGSIYEFAFGPAVQPVVTNEKKLLFTIKVYDDGTTEKVM
jgi:predicted peptidase